MNAIRLLPILAVAALAAAGCGESETASPASEPTTASTAAPADGDAAAAHNDADIAFLQGMIPHHAQAIEMSDIVLERSDNEAVTELAERIKAAQGPEIAQMQDLLDEWGVEPDAGGEHAGHGGGGMAAGGGDGMAMAEHGGMLSDEEMSRLAAAEGAELDRLFLTGMIAHHRGAVVSSETELEEGESAEAKELARAIIEAQEAEIAEMEQLLNEV